MKKSFANTFGRVLAEIGRNEMLINGYNTVK